MFALSVQNTTNLDKTFRITIANQPLLANGTVDPAGFASLEQFGPIVTTEDVTIPAQLAVSRPIFAQSANPTASVMVNVQEITSPGRYTGLRWLAGKHHAQPGSHSSGDH